MDDPWAASNANTTAAQLEQVNLDDERGQDSADRGNERNEADTGHPQAEAVSSDESHSADQASDLRQDVNDTASALENQNNKDQIATDRNSEQQQQTNGAQSPRTAIVSDPADRRIAVVSTPNDETASPAQAEAIPNAKDVEPSPMSAAPKTPSQKTLEKSLKRSKAAPALLPTVISKTRQRDLPPKAREEDNKHLQEYNEMLALAKALERKRAEAAANRQQVKETLVTTHTSTWESSIVPNWKRVLEDDKLRQVWWSGSMPARFRANLWTACIGNSLMIGKSSFQKSLALAKNLIATGRMPESIPLEIKEDIEITLPQTKLFQQPSGPLSGDLEDLLLAYSVFWKDTPSYARGVSFIAAMLLVSMPIQPAFTALVNIINNTFLRYFYDRNQEYMDAYDRIFSTLLADYMPAVSHNFIANNVRPLLYLHPWLTTVYAYFLPLDCATRVFDVFVLEGESFLFRIGLALLQTMEARLFNPDFDELTALFQAKDKGARALVARDKAAKYGGQAEDIQVWPEEVYAQCGATEEALFEALDKMPWRENSWQRICTRELPD